MVRNGAFIITSRRGSFWVNTVQGSALPDGLVPARARTVAARRFAND